MRAGAGVRGRGAAGRGWPPPGLPGPPALQVGKSRGQARSPASGATPGGLRGAARAWRGSGLQGGAASRPLPPAQDAGCFSSPGGIAPARRCFQPALAQPLKPHCRPPNRSPGATGGDRGRPGPVCSAGKCWRPKALPLPGQGAGPMLAQSQRRGVPGWSGPCPLSYPALPPTSDKVQS